MSQYMVKGNRVEVIADGAINLQTSLAPNTYFIKFENSPNFQGFYLERGDNFTDIKKVYGDLEKRTDRIINTYLERKKRNVNTGVLLSGIKGSGKTLQAKVISNSLRVKHKIPTIIVSDAYDSAMLSLFLKDITDPSIILFEEFEKMYKSFGSNDRYRDEDVQSSGNARIGLKDSQEGLLTLLDGVMNSNKLFIFTCNSPNYVNDLLLNRPGRVWYHFKYLGLEEDVIEDYCNEKLKNKAYLTQIKQISDFLDEGFTFDIMQSLVEEVNRYKISPLDAVSILNIEPQPFSNLYEWVVTCDDNSIAVVNSRYKQTKRINNYLSNEAFSVEVSIKIRNKNDKKLVRELERASLLMREEIHDGFRPHPSYCDDDDEDGRSVGFHAPNEGFQLAYISIILNRDNLVSSSKKTLIYKKFGMTFTFNKLDPRNYWENLSSMVF